MNLTTLIVFLICFACFAGMFVYILFRLTQIEEKIDELTEDEEIYQTTEDLNAEIDEIIDKAEISSQVNSIMDK